MSAVVEIWRSMHADNGAESQRQCMSSTYDTVFRSGRGFPLFQPRAALFRTRQGAALQLRILAETDSRPRRIVEDKEIVMKLYGSPLRSTQKTIETSLIRGARLMCDYVCYI